MKLTKSEKRKKLLINPRFQTQFVAFSLVICLLVALFFFGSNLYFFHKLRGIGQTFGLANTNPFFTLISQQETMMQKILIFSTSCLLALITLAGLLFSHKISGPLLRLNERMADTSSLDNDNKLRFRKSDFFPELAHEFNQMIDRLKKSR